MWPAIYVDPKALLETLQKGLNLLVVQGLTGLPWWSSLSSSVQLECHIPYPLVMTNMTIENHHRNSGFSHEKW